MALELLCKAFKLNNTTTTKLKKFIKPLLQSDSSIGLSVVSEIANQYGNGNVVTKPAEGNGNGINGNPIRCYNCRGEGHYASNGTVKPKKLDAVYLQQQLQFVQEEEVGIQITQEECEFMAAADAYEETERVKVNRTSEDTLQQASTFGTQSDSTPVYDSDGSTEVHHLENCYDNDIFNMFTQEEQYTELLEPILKPHQVQQNDSNVISEVSCVKQSGGTIVQHPATPEETHALYDSLYNNLATEVEKVNSVNLKLKETNADLTTELARYKNQKTQWNQHSLYNGNVLLEKNESHVVYVQRSTRELAQDFSDDTTPSVARKFLNEVKSTIVTLQRVVKQKMTLDTHNWSSFAHQEIHKIVKDEIFPIVNQVDAIVQNFEIQFLKEADKFVRDFQSLAKEADESLAKNKALESEIERLLKAVGSQDIMSIVQNNSVAQTKAIIDSLQDKLHDTIYENAKLRAQLFDKVSEQKDTNKGTSVNTQFSKQSILGKPPSSSKPKLYYVTPFPKSTVIPKVGSKERLASPKPSTPRSCLKWSPTGRMFDLKGKIIATSESECQRDCSKSDNACTSNPQEPINKRFPCSTFSMPGCQNWFDTLLIPLLFEYKSKDKETYRDNECDN
ncbi:hypothetical protein Tco_0735995 [Tanacetum coccineum]